MEMGRVFVQGRCQVPAAGVTIPRGCGTVQTFGVGQHWGAWRSVVKRILGRAGKGLCPHRGDLGVREIAACPGS